MARFRVGGGGDQPIRKWSDIKPETELRGRFVGVREGKFGWLLDLDTNEGRMTLPVVAALDKPISRIKVGAMVTFHYGGLKVGRSGSNYHHVEVYTDSADDVMPAPRPEATASHSRKDDEVPDEVPF